MSSIQKVGNFTESFLKAMARPKQENFVTGVKLIASAALHVGVFHGHTLLITKKVSSIIWMYSRHQVCDDSGKPRRPDDFQPRVNISKLVKMESSI